MSLPTGQISSTSFISLGLKKADVVAEGKSIAREKLPSRQSQGLLRMEKRDGREGMFSMR